MSLGMSTDFSVTQFCHLFDGLVNKGAYVRRPFEGLRVGPFKAIKMVDGAGLQRKVSTEICVPLLLQSGSEKVGPVLGGASPREGEGSLQKRPASLN